MSSLVSYWPAPGLLVPFPGPSDAPLASSGAQAAPTDYLTGLVMQGELKTSNPDGSSTPAPVNYFQYALYCSALTASLGVFGGQVIDVIGYATAQDGGEGQFYWNPTSTATADGGLVFGSALLGRWTRRTDSESRRVVKWWGAKGDGVADDTAAIQAAINAGVTDHSEVFFPAGDYKITSLLRVSTWGLRLTGEAGNAVDDGGTRLVWSYTSATNDDGANRTLMQVTGFGQVFTNLTFYNGVNGDPNYRKKIAGYGVAFGNFSGEAFVSTRGQVFNQCQWFGFRAGCVLDRDQVVTGNLDFITFNSCAWHAHDKCFWIRGGQPINIVFNECSMAGLDPTGTYSAFGYGIWHDGPSGGSIVFASGTLTYLCCGVYLSYNLPLHLEDCDLENTKQVIRNYDFTGAGECGLAITGGRYAYALNSDNAGAGHSYLAGADIPASNHYFIECASAVSLSLLGASFTNGYTTDANFRIAVNGEVTLIDDGCLYPNATPFVRLVSINQTAGNAATPAGTFSRGSTCIQADPIVPTRVLTTMPQLNGPSNPSGVVTISGAATSATVTFATAEPVATFADLTTVVYHVQCSIEDATAGSVIGVPYVTGKTSTGFTVNLSAAPTAGKTVRIRYAMSL